MYIKKQLYNSEYMSLSVKTLAKKLLTLSP